MRLLLSILVTANLCYAAFSQCGSVRIVADVTKDCQPVLVTYHLENSPEGVTYRWDVGNGPQLATDTFYQLHLNPGFIDISCTITYPDGSTCTVQHKNIVEVFTRPEPQFMVSRSLLCDGPDTVTLKDLTPNIARRNWVIDGTNYTDADEEQIHKLVTTGTKDISLVVTDSNGCEGVLSEKEVITVYPSLSYDFEADVRQGCKPQVVNFQLKGLKDTSKVIAHFWEFSGADFTSDNAKAPKQKQYFNAGEYDVSLQLQTNYGCTYNLRKNNYIRIGDTVQIELNTDIEGVCIGDSIVVRNKVDNTNNLASFNWKTSGTLHDTLKKQDELIIIGQDTGYIDVGLTYVYNGCVSSVNISPFFRVDGVKSDFISDNHFHCEVPHTVNLQNKTNLYGESSAQYKWEIVKDGQIIKSTDSFNASHTFYTMPAEYDVRLIALSANGCSDTAFRKGYIYQDSLKLAFNVVPDIACLNQEVQLLNRTKPSSYLSSDNFKWFFYDLDGKTILDSSELRSPYFSYSDTGYYDIKLVGANGINCRDTLDLEDAVYIIKPELDYTISDTILCKGENLSLKGNSKPVIAPFEYDWVIRNKYNGSLQSFNKRQNVNTQFKQAGDYKLIMNHRIADGCVMYDSVDLFINGLDVKIVLDTFGGCGPLEVNPSIEIVANKHHGASSNAVVVNWRVNPGRSYTVDSDTVLQPRYILSEDLNYRFAVNATNSANCQAKTTSNKVEVGVRAGFDILTPVVCFGDKLSVRNTSDLSNSVDWRISPQVQTTRSQNNSIYSFTIPEDGQFKITQIVSKANQCFDSLTKNFNVVEVIANFGVSDSLLNCAPVFAEFQSTSKNGDTLYWDYGDGNKSITESTESGHIYSRNSGFSNGYDIKLVAKSVDGCMDMLLKPDYVVVQGPVPDFSITNNVGCDPLQVEFLDQTIDAITLLYDYGDGSELKNDVNHGDLHHHVYTNTLLSQKEQLYVPALIASDSLGCVARQESSDTIRVLKKPIIQVDLNSTNNNCIPFEVSFENKPKFTSNYQWILDGDTLVQNQSGTIKLESLGDKKLEVRAQNDIGCRDSITTPIIPLETPIVSFFTPDSICMQESFDAIGKLQAQSPIKDVKWDFSNPTSFRIEDLFGLKFNMNYDSPGLKELSLEITLDNACSSRDTQKVYITHEQDIDQPQIEVVSLDGSNSIKMVHQSSIYNKFNEYHYHSKLENRRNNNKRDTVQVFNVRSDLSDSVCFDLKVKDDCELFGERSYRHCTVFLTADSENPYEVDLHWTPYVGWNSVHRYNIYRNDGEGWRLLTSVPGNQLTYTDTKLCDQLYEYYVQAIHPLGTLVSNSNETEIEPIYVFNPQSAHVSNVSVTNPNEITVNWKPSTFSEFDYYKLYKFEDDGEIPTEIVETKTTEYLDVNVATSEMSYRYELEEIDRCGNVSDGGRFGKSILLKGYYDKSAFLDWSAYQEYENGVKDYKIEIKNATDYKLVSREPASSLVYEDEEYHREIYGEYCYRITATSGSEDSSFSNVVCLGTQPVLITPNAFTPDKNGLNEVFRPVAQFVYDGEEFKPESYELLIFNRWGELIFQSNNLSIGWDGIYKDKPVQQGTYIYQLKAQGTDNRFIYQKGSVTLLR